MAVTKGYVQNSPFIQKQAQNAVAALSKAGNYVPSSNAVLGAAGAGIGIVGGAVILKELTRANKPLPTNMLGVTAELDAESMPVEQKQYEENENQPVQFVKYDVEEAQQVADIQKTPSLFDTSACLAREDEQKLIAVNIVPFIDDQDRSEGDMQPEQSKEAHAKPAFSLNQITQDADVETVVAVVPVKEDKEPVVNTQLSLDSAPLSSSLFYDSASGSKKHVTWAEPLATTHTFKVKPVETVIYRQNEEADQPIKFAFDRAEKLPMQQYKPVEEFILNTVQKPIAGQNNALLNTVLPASNYKFVDKGNGKQRVVLIPTAKPAPARPVFQLRLVEEKPIVENTQKADIKTQQELLKKVSALDSQGNTVLHRAVIENDEQMVRALLKTFVKNTNCVGSLIHDVKNKNGLSVSELAIELQRWTLLEIMIESV
jgi:hypothetical protein